MKLVGHGLHLGISQQVLKGRETYLQPLLHLQEQADGSIGNLGQWPIPFTNGAIPAAALGRHMRNRAVA